MNMAEANAQVADTGGPDENGNESSQQSSDESRNDCLYCFCQEVEHGPMIVCGLTVEVQGKWYRHACDTVCGTERELERTRGTSQISNGRC